MHHSAAPGQIGIVFPVTLGVTGSTQSFISGLTERAATTGLRKAWVDVAKARAEWETELQGVVKHDAEPIQSQFVAHMIRKVLPRNGLLVVDAGNGGKHVRSYFKSYEPGTFLCIDDWASVGGSFPIALGAKLARPDRPVLCASGEYCSAPTGMPVSSASFAIASVASSLITPRPTTNTGRSAAASSAYT